MPMSAPQRRRAEGAKSSGRITKTERRRQLLAAGKQVFEVQGYLQTTPALIAEAAAVSEALLTRYFADKKALFLDILLEIRRATLDRWKAETAGLADPLAKLHHITDGFLQDTRRLNQEFRILHRTLVECDDEEVLGGLRTYFLDCEAHLAQVISEGQQAGLCRRSFDPRVGAWELIHSVLGQSLTLSLRLPLHQDDFLPQAVDCLLNCWIKTDV
jgi:AcrR family transcriptional regulator